VFDSFTSGCLETGIEALSTYIFLATPIMTLHGLTRSGILRSGVFGVARARLDRELSSEVCLMA
jgi:hypothetical protein